jgi:hypothetical protein
MAEIQVWKGLSNAKFNIEPTASLSQLRAVINNVNGPLKLTGADHFLYYDKMGDQESILPLGREATLAVSALMKQSDIKVVDTASKRPDLIGVITDRLWNRNLSVEVPLNNEPNAQAKNGTRFQPIMMTNVRSANPKDRSNFNQVVICEDGSQVMFRINSWCPAGFGYRIRPGRSKYGDIASGLYILSNQNNHSGHMVTDLQRYQNSQQMIDVSACADIGIPAVDEHGFNRGFYQQITVQSWRVMDYELEGGARYVSDAMPPPSAYDPNVPPDFNTAKRGGVVSGEDVRAGAARPGAASGQKFGGMKIVHRQDNPDQNQLLGEVIFYFFLFKDRSAAEKIILGVNAPDGTPYG